MGKRRVKETNQLIQITLPKSMVEAIDGIRFACNKQLQEGDHLYTRSDIIRLALIQFMTTDVRIPVEHKTGKEN